MDYQVYIKFFIWGALGALGHMLVCDNKLVLPRAISGALVLGFIGPMVVGGFVGAIADGSLIAASLAGYTGSSVLEKFLPGIKIDQLNENEEGGANVPASGPSLG